MYIDIGNRREVFWDDYLIDTDWTTAKLTAHMPVKKEIVYDENVLWQHINRISYPIYIELDDQCLMYYITGIPCENRKELTKDFNKMKNQLNVLCLLKGPDLYHLEQPKKRNCVRCIKRKMKSYINFTKCPNGIDRICLIHYNKCTRKRLSKCDFQSDILQSDDSEPGDMDERHRETHR